MQALNSFGPLESNDSSQRRVTLKWNNIDNWLKVTDVLLAFVFGYIGYSEWQKNNQLWAICFIALGMLFLSRTVIEFRTSKMKCSLRKCPFCAESVT